MKILLFAYACSPSHGSEGAVGWKAATALAKRHRVHVITNAGWRPQLEEAREAGRVADTLTFHYIGRRPRWHPNRMLARLQSWNYYRRDLAELLPLAERLHGRERFDLTHHVTYASWRIGTELWRLPVPHVWGPLGGGESVPPAFDATLSWKARQMERLRRLANAGLLPQGAARRTARRSALCIAANAETLAVLGRLRGSEEGTARLLHVFFTPEEAARFDAPSRRARAADGPLRLFAGGNLEGGKGFRLALEALALARRRDAGFDFHYTLGGHGPELESLREAAVRLGIAERVTFHGGFRGEAYPDQLGAAHAYLLPSLRDSAGTTLMEAMLAGCAPVVARRGGPGEIVTADAGNAVEADTPEAMASALATILLRLHDQREEAASLGAGARRRILTGFMESNYLDALDGLYREATDARLRPRAGMDDREG